MTEVSRRKFLIGGTAVAVGTTLDIGSGGTAQADALTAKAGASTGTETADAPGLTASHFGTFTPQMRDGRFAGVIPFQHDPRPNAMIDAYPSRVYSAARVRHPMVRKSYLERGWKAGGGARGAEEFVRVSWDKALDLVASELQRVKASHGNESIYGGSYGWHSAGKLHVPQTLLHRMLNLHGGYVDITGDYSTGASQVILPHVVGTIEVYEQQTAWPVVLEHTDLIVLWGADLAKSNRIGWQPPDHYVYTALEKLRGGRGAKNIQVISIDPIRTTTAEALNAEWIAPRPNTDVALMLGIAHTLYTRKLHNQQFVDRYTVGFPLFLNYLTGKVDGTPKDANWAARITGIAAQRIVDLAQRMVAGRTMLMSGWGIQRQDHGEQPHWMLVTLAAMIGQIGLPGGGFGLSYHYGSGGSPSSSNPGIPGMSAIPSSGTSQSSTPWLQHAELAFPVARLTDLLAHPGKQIDFNGKKLTYPDIHLVYWAGGNPLHHQEQINALLRAWQRPETVIVQDPFWTASAKFADIVLPAATEMERNDIDVVGDYSNRYIVSMHRVVEPVAESRTDYDIFTQLSKRLAFEQGFTEGKTEMDWIRSFYEAGRKSATAQHIAMPDFDTFWSKGYVEFEVPEASRKFVRYADFRSDPVAHPLGTPSGKIEIYSPTIAGFHYDDCRPHPTWMEPAEWLGSDKARHYPLHLMSPHPDDRLHSQLDNTLLREAYEIHGREPVWIHPDDARARSIRSGDIVRVFNERGALLAAAVLTERVRKSVVALHEGAWYDPLEPGRPGTLDKHGDVNVLTLDKGTSRLAQGNIANTALVQIERYHGKLPPITAFDPPAEGNV